MSKAKWIWYRNDFEMYHHLILSCRRQEKGCDYPCMWHLSQPERSVNFYKTFTVPKDTVIRVVTHSKGMVRIAKKMCPVNTDIPIEAGEYTVHIEIMDLEKFPSIFIDSEYLVTDETWTADAHDLTALPVSCNPIFENADDDPAVFPFYYEEIFPVKTEKKNGGVLYDFGKETFGIVSIENKNIENISLTYGESEAEALDYENAIIRETLTENDSPVRPARAFRYLFVKSEKDVKITVKYEYLPIEDIAYFECEDEEIKKIWDVCAYTFHLNSREFFLDGIKRDRWVWSGDAYQSFMINRCLYNDDNITERTIKALLGKPPYRMHTNSINDYSAYLILSVWEHYFHSGNKKFLDEVYPDLKELYKFIISRLDEETGYVVPRAGDWIFIDWGELDKTGAHCFEQILLWRVYKVMQELSAVMGENEDYSSKADELKGCIIKDYWKDDKGAFIDSFESGKNFVSRQTNVMAILMDFADEKQKESIIKNVFENDSHPQIKTPYFKLYELLALCKCSKIEVAQDYIKSYWGQMLSLGATSVWEEFNPDKKGNEHYAMYGSLYGKSLCHAWGSGPILLLISHCAGINPDSVGSKTYTVKPNPGKYKKFKACAPIRNGKVFIEYDNGKVSVLSDVDGGKLIYNGKEYEITANRKLEI